MKIIEYNLSVDRICLGERVKGGTYRPCSKVIPYTRVVGAFESNLGLSLHGIGIIKSIDNVNHLTIAPNDRGKDTVKLPIKVMYLEGVKGNVYILNHENISEKLENRITLLMGGLRMRGFGKCFLDNKKEYELGMEDCGEGILNTRIPVSEAKTFDINVLKAKLGYLFVREDDETGQYVLSYFEGSRIQGPKFLFKGGMDE